MVRSSRILEGTKILALGSDERMLLPVLRSLAAAGSEVDIGWCTADCPALASRHVRRVHELSPYRQGGDEWSRDLNALQSRLRFDLILPVTESAVFVLQNHHQQLVDRDRLLLIGDRAYETFSNKEQTQQLAARLGVPCPRSVRVSSAEDALTRVRAADYPLVIKPCSSYQDAAQLDKLYARTVQTSVEAEAYLRFLAPSGTPVQLEAFFQGVGVGVELLAAEGKIVMAMQHRRLHETNGHGSTYRTTEALDPELLAAAGRLVAAVNLSGVAMVEFRRNPQTGKWVLLEVNARFWGSLPLAAAAGVDFPRALVCQRLGLPIPDVACYRVGVRSRSLTSDLRWTWRRLCGKRSDFELGRTGSLGWAINQISHGQFAWHLLRGCLGLDCIDTFAWSDPRPAWAEAGGLCRVAAARLAGRSRGSLPDSSEVNVNSEAGESSAEAPNSLAS